MPLALDAVSNLVQQAHGVFSQNNHADVQGLVERGGTVDALWQVAFLHVKTEYRPANLRRWRGIKRRASRQQKDGQ